VVAVQVFDGTRLHPLRIPWYGWKLPLRSKLEEYYARRRRRPDCNPASEGTMLRRSSRREAAKNTVRTVSGAARHPAAVAVPGPLSRIETHRSLERIGRRPSLRGLSLIRTWLFLEMALRAVSSCFPDGWVTRSGPYVFIPFRAGNADLKTMSEPERETSSRGCPADRRPAADHDAAYRRGYVIACVQTYERELKDIFALQDRISRAVSTRCGFGSAENSPEAYRKQRGVRLYLKAAIPGTRTTSPIGGILPELQRSICHGLPGLPVRTPDRDSRHRFPREAAARCAQIDETLTEA